LSFLAGDSVVALCYNGVLASIDEDALREACLCLILFSYSFPKWISGRKDGISLFLFAVIMWGELIFGLEILLLQLYFAA